MNIISNLENDSNLGNEIPQDTHFWRSLSILTHSEQYLCNCLHNWISTAETTVLGVLHQKQTARARTNNYIPQILWDVITCSCPWYLILAQHSSNNVACSLPRKRAIWSDFELKHIWYLRSQGSKGCHVLWVYYTKMTTKYRVHCVIGRAI